MYEWKGVEGRKRNPVPALKFSRFKVSKSTDEPLSKYICLLSKWYILQHKLAIEVLLNLQPLFQSKGEINMYFAGVRISDRWCNTVFISLLHSGGHD